MRSLKELFQELFDTTDEQVIERFAIWSFGENHAEIQDGINFMEAWNTLHKEKLELTPAGIISYDVLEMIKLYKESKCENG
jgi:hypothetical protein